MANARVCLFNPIECPTYPPLSLTYLSAYLRRYGRHSYEFLLVDVNCDANPIQRILEFRPDVVGFATLSSHIVDIYDYSKQLREQAPALFQVAGGAHASVCPEEMLEVGHFDVVVIGEGEITFMELVDRYLDQDRTLPLPVLAQIQGIACRNPDGSILRTPPAELIKDLDTIPHPDRWLLNNAFYHKRYYVQRGMNTAGVTTIAGSRGCPYRCIFCCVNFTTDGKMRFHSPEHIADEIQETVEKHGAKWLFFTDDVFFVRRDHTRALCEELIRRGLNKKVKWEVQIRSNLVREKDLELLKLMKSAGCEQIDYGFESGNPRVLTLIKGKGITVEDHERALRLTYEAGIAVVGTFILGTPSETLEEMEDTRQFILRNMKQITRFQVSCMIPYPGTLVYQMCVDKGMMAPSYYQEMLREREKKDEHGLRVYCDSMPHDQVLRMRNELDVLSFKKITTLEKAQWLAYNLRHNFHTAFIGILWVIGRHLLTPMGRLLAPFRQQKPTGNG